MPLRRLPRHRLRRCLSGLVAGVALALMAVPALAAPPSFSSELAGTPPSPNPNAPASLAITVRTCPPGYDPTASTANPQSDCREPAGDTAFGLSRGGAQGPSASTGTSGDAPQQSTVRFTQLTPGRYRVTATAPAEIAGAFVGACASDRRDLASPFVPFAAVVDGAVTLDLQAGETLSCDWFQIAGAS